MSSHPPPVLRAYWDGRADICDLEQGIPKDGTGMKRLYIQSHHDIRSKNAKDCLIENGDFVHIKTRRGVVGMSSWRVKSESA